MGIRTFRLNKLVRDEIVPKMRAEGQEVQFRALDSTEFLAQLSAKLVEEAREFEASSPKSVEELVDIQEVLDALAKAVGASPEEIRAVQEERRKQLGSFDTQTFVETVGVPDDDNWAEYYAEDPERFPEE